MKINLLFFDLKVIRYFSLMTLFFILVSSEIKSQTYFFERYGVEQGLSFSKVYSIIQDKNDLVWLGTEGGASRFNGIKFENFGTARGMAPDGVMSLFMDTTGRIWFGHLNGGLTYFDGRKFVKTRFDSLRIKSDITSIRQIGEFIWATTSKDGAFKIAFPATGDSVLTCSQYLGINGLSDQVVGSYIDRKGNLYCIAAEAGIKKYNPGKDIFETLSPPGLTKYFITTVMYEDSKGNFWYGTNKGGLYKFDIDSGKMRIYDIRDGLANQTTTYITEDYGGNVWVGSWGGGVTVFSDDKIRIYDNSNGLEALYVHCILEDREKNMIIADHSTGISIFKGDHFITYSDQKFLPDKNVLAVAEDNSGKLWFGTNAGISVLYKDNQGNTKVKFYNEVLNSLGRKVQINKIQFIKSDKKENIWIGTEGYGIFRFDIRRNIIFDEPNINSKLSYNGIITALELDGNGRLWVGNMDRLIVWDIEKGKDSTFTQENGLAGSWISAIYFDNEGFLWIGSEEQPGLTKYDINTGKFTIIYIGEGFIPKTIARTPDRKIWIGTNNGLLALQGDSVFIYLNQEKGLLSNNIKLLQSDGSNFLYIGTNHGLNSYNLLDGTISSYTKRNGFPGVEANLNASISDRGGNLWFGTANGVTMLKTAAKPNVITLPSVHISSMDVNYTAHKMVEGDRLNYKVKIITFYFYSVCLVNPDAAKYEVMLKGEDADWIPAEQNRKSYSSLSPGRYTFMVRACNSYGYWNETAAEYSFVKKPPFYFSPWFIAGCIALLTFSIYSYIKITERNLIKEKIKLKNIIEERTQEVVEKKDEIARQRDVVTFQKKKITDSINYAEKIQLAVLPEQKILEKTFSDYFIIYLPKDIVSGDFYWMSTKKDNIVFITADCTGHGVPGAFMSMLGVSFLNKIVNESGIIEPSQILTRLRENIISALKQKGSFKERKDGMDIAICSYNLKKMKLLFSGANNPLYLIRKVNDEYILIEKKGDMMPVGIHSTMDDFTRHELPIQKGDTIYLFSDGFADQFGGPDGRKFMRKRFIQMLLDNQELDMSTQKETFIKILEEWINYSSDKNKYVEQTDDIILLGVRI